MHEKDELYRSFLFPFLPLVSTALPLAEQPVPLVQNGMYCCLCAAHDKCQQLDCVFVHRVPTGL